jgi:hypothetical protein
MNIDWMTVAFSLVNTIPSILAWLTGVVLATVMLRRGGAGPEKLLLAGCGIMLFTAVAGPVVRTLVYYWVDTQDNMSYTSAAVAMSIVSLIVAFIGLVALACLMVAFWKRIVKSEEEVV